MSGISLVVLFSLLLFARQDDRCSMFCMYNMPVTSSTVCNWL